jgi:hypothetical protein
MTMPDDPLSMKHLEKTIEDIKAFNLKRNRLDASMEGDFDTSALRLVAEKRLRAHNEVCMSVPTKLIYRPSDLTPRQIEWCRAWISAFNPKVTP